MAGRNCNGLVCLLLTFVLCAFCLAGSGDFAYFDTEDVGKPDRNAPLIEPWKIVALDPNYAGQWMVAADVDGDGRDEIMAGYAMLNHDGSVRWVFKSKKVDQSRGHLDCAHVVRQGGSAEDFRIAIIDGNDEILIAHKGGLYNDKGKRIATFHTPGAEISAGKPKYEKSMLIGDMTGDGISDVVVATPHAAYIYRNARGRKPDKAVPLGTEFNFTLY